MEVTGDGAATSQLPLVCSQRQLQRLTDGDVQNDTTLSPHHLHQACYHSATKCRTQCDYSPSNSGQLARGATSPVDAGGDGRPAHVVIDALRTASDDVGRLRRLPTSQITCRILPPPTAVQRSPADPVGRGKLIMPVCDDRGWTSVVGSRTALTNGDCRPHRLPTTQRPPLTAYHRHGDPNGNS